ncbi:MAG: nucleotidyltransferase family protein [Pseudomonadota bacterium]
MAVPHTAMLLAAGLGTRMRPLTDNTPKPLIPVAGRSILDRLIDALVEAGVTRLVINVHWLADKVEAHMAGIGGVEVLISDERDNLLETGGGIVKAAPLLGDDPVWVLNTDAFWAPTDIQPLVDLAAAYDPAAMDDLLLLADRERTLGYPGAGDFHCEPDGRLRRRGDDVTAPWAYAGVRITKPQLYKDEPLEPFSANRIWDRLIPAGRLHGLAMDRFWLHVGDPSALADADMWMRCHGP